VFPHYDVIALGPLLILFFCEATIYSRSLKRIMGLNAMYFESGEGLGMNKLEAKSWRRCQKLMQSRNSKDYFLRRLGTHGKLGSEKLIFRSSLGNFTLLILYGVKNI